MYTPIFEAARIVRIPFRNGAIDGELAVPDGAYGIAVLAHGPGSSRNSPRNRLVARLLRDQGFGTVLIDCNREPCLSIHEPDLNAFAEQLSTVAAWLREEEAIRLLARGFVGSGNGAAAALLSAALDPEAVQAVITRGACAADILEMLPNVVAPTLLVVGARDHSALEANRHALTRIAAPEKRLEVVPGAGHMFDEPGTLAAMALHAANWLARHLAGIDKAVVSRPEVVPECGHSRATEITSRASAA